MRVRSVAGCLVLLLGAACSKETSPRMELLGVAPSHVSVRVDTPAVLTGRNFYNVASADLSASAPPAVYRDWRVSVPLTVMSDEPATYQDSQRLRITLPAGLPLGWHDLSLTAPDGETQLLSAAFLVQDGSGGAGGASQGGAGGDAQGSAGASGQGGAGGLGQGGAGGAAGATECRLAYWPFDETAGTVAHDASGNGYDADLAGYSSPGWTTGRIGGSLAFDGMTEWAQVSDAGLKDALVGANEFTVAAWVLIPVARNDWNTIVSWQYQATIGEHFGLYMYQGFFTLNVNSQQFPSPLCSDFTPAPIGQWVHVAGTCDGTTSRLYVSGAERCSDVRPQTLTSDTTPLIIGGNDNGSAGIPNELFGGSIDELVIYCRALSATEIASIAAGNPPPAG